MLDPTRDKSIHEFTGYKSGLNDRLVETDLDADAQMMRTDVNAIAAGLSRSLGLPQDRLGKILNNLARKAPPDTFQDAVQSISMVWLDEKPDRLEFCYGIGKNIVSQLWRAYHRHSHIALDAESGVDLKLDSELSQEQRTQRIEAQLRGALVDHAEWTLIDSMDSMDAVDTITTLFASIPQNIREIIQTRLDGIRLSDGARQTLNRYVKAHGVTIRHMLATA